MRYKAICGFNGVALEKAPDGFEAKVIYGNFKTIEEAEYSSNVGCSGTFKCDQLAKLSLDNEGFFLKFISYEGKEKILRYPEFKIIVRKYHDCQDSEYIKEENMIDWNIPIDELHKQLKTLADKKQIKYSCLFDSLYYGTEEIKDEGFRCPAVFLDKNKCQELLNDISTYTLNVSMKEWKLNKFTREILTNDLKSIFRNEYYHSDNEKKLHLELIQLFENMDYNNIQITIDQINFYCGTWDFKYRISTEKSQNIENDILLLKEITINDDFS